VWVGGGCVGELSWDLEHTGEGGGPIQLVGVAWVSGHGTPYFVGGLMG